MSLLTQVLSRQHRRVINRIDETERAPERGILKRLADEVVGHTLTEEELVYPVFSSSIGTHAQAVEEHAIVRYALERLLSAGRDQVAFEARLRMLRELLVHHTEREERARLPNIEQKLGVRRSKKLAEEVATRFSQLVARGYKSALRRRP